MVKPASMVVAMKTLLIILFGAMIASFVYVSVTDAFTDCYTAWTSRWDVLLVIDCTVLYAISGAWFHYKESSWIKTALFFIGMEIAGSIVPLPYIFYQFFKLSPEEASRDPLYFVLARHKKREQELTKGTTVATARVFFSALGVLMLGVLIYTVIFDIVTHYAVPVSPCLVPYLVDIYIYAVLLSVWIVYKESCWIIAFVWIVLIFFSATIAISVYLVWELFNLSPDQPAYLIIFSSKDRALESSEAPLISHADV